MNWHTKKSEHTQKRDTCEQFNTRQRKLNQATENILELGRFRIIDGPSEHGGVHTKGSVNKAGIINKEILNKWEKKSTSKRKLFISTTEALWQCSKVDIIKEKCWPLKPCCYSFHQFLCRMLAAFFYTAVTLIRCHGCVTTSELPHGNDSSLQGFLNFFFGRKNNTPTTHKTQNKNLISSCSAVAWKKCSQYFK